MKKIGVVTGSRAEYGLLYWLLKDIQNDPGLTLQLYVTGAHLSGSHGKTVTEIEKDGFDITARIPVLKNNDSDNAKAIVKAVTNGIEGCADAFSAHKPDIIVVLGDRYEILAAAQAAFFLHIPVAHIGGGHVTEGAMDDCIRHMITKMATLHFTATDIYRKRIIQMGENPDTVFTVGSTGLDNIRRETMLSREELEKQLGHKLEQKVFVLTFHPETTRTDLGIPHLENLLETLPAYFDEHTTLVITGSNADEGRGLIETQLKSFCEKHEKNTVYTQSLGRIGYLSLQQYATVVVGNSSSGLIETPAFKIPTVNIGDRQKGRIRPDSIIDADGSSASITSAIEKALADDFRKKLETMENPFGDGHASERIKDILSKSERQAVKAKSFYDIEFETGA